MTERVLIASANPWSFCMAVERDLARENRNAQVDGIDLFTLCSRFSPHWRSRDRIIEKINRKIAGFVMPAINGREITNDVQVKRGEFPPLPECYEALRTYELDGAKIGLAVLSSVSSLTTIQYPSSLGEFGSVLKAAWASAHLSLTIGEAVSALGYDKVIIFNGRHCYSRPFCEVLEQDAEVIRYEQASAGNRYISNAGSVHSPAALKRLIEAHPPDRGAGDAFFRARFEKHPSTEVELMTARQQDGALPAGMLPDRAVIFFTSASDELFAVTDEPLYGIFRTQHDIAMALATICSTSGSQLVVRLHPHLRFKHPAWKREWNFPELERQGALIVDPDDPADSYAMLRAARSVVTAGSTIGLEAAYLGIPNAVVGTWLAGSLGASVVASTPELLARFIAQPRLLQNARDAALLFGSFYRTAGKPLPELDVGVHPNLARIDGRIVDPVRCAARKLRFLVRPAGDPATLDIRSGMQGGRVLLPPGTNYGRAAISGVTSFRRASTEKSLAGE
jgi:hypothetical protein